MAAMGPSKAVMAARSRRATSVRWEWKDKQVFDKIAITLKARMRLAVTMLSQQVTKNISRPVTKSTGVRSGRIVVTNRSKPGEYPKADTTLLRKTIFADVRAAGRGSWDGFVGTPQDYGVILELRMKRSFLVRTLNENKQRIVKMLTGPIKA